MSTISNRPVAFIFLLPNLMNVARKCGYALAIHGSLQRDFDLIAVPWNDDAIDPESLYNQLIDACGGIKPSKTELADLEYNKPLAHGRLGYTIALGHDLYIDLSIMPRRIV